jgi:hypothetical protein
MPVTPPGSSGIRISLGEVVQWPGGTIELSYSKCQGDMTGIGLPNPAGTTPPQTWFGSLKPCFYKANIGYTQSNFNAGSYNSCYLPADGTTWYANVRLTYSSCVYGGGTACGPSIQWNHQ